MMLLFLVRMKRIVNVFILKKYPNNGQEIHTWCRYLLSNHSLFRKQFQGQRPRPTDFSNATQVYKAIAVFIFTNLLLSL